MNEARRTPPRGPALLRFSRGFTLTELVISLSFLALVLLTLATLMFSAARTKGASANSVESVQAARVAMEMMAKDIRSAGYGADLYQPTPQYPFAYVDSLQVIVNENLLPADDSSPPAEPQAYSPAGYPRPFPLDGTPWEPVMKYTTGAEAIRYTLDLNNDGAVDSLDWTDPNGGDAMRSQNPGDYVLVRQTYGDLCGGTLGNNGGQVERIARVQRPGAGVPPLFTVYLKGSATPWDWSKGPVPALELRNIERVEIHVTAASSKTDWRDHYATTELRTVVNSLRNTPGSGPQLYVVTGRVFDDRDHSHDWSPPDAGLANARVWLGDTYSARTMSGGRFSLSVPAGTYTLRHSPPPGYGAIANPDSFVVNVPGSGAYAFADTASPGGWVVASAYEDLDGDGRWDAGESPLAGVTMTLTPGGSMEHTDAEGVARLFAAPGGYSVRALLPETLVPTRSNPQGGVLADRDSAFQEFGGQYARQGVVAGRVFDDTNRNGEWDAGEPGARDAWVGVSTDNGLTVAGYQYTDSAGAYSIPVPVNDPPRMPAYSVSCIVPAGRYATTPTSRGPVRVRNNVAAGGLDFGIAPYSTLTLSANRVLSLASGDLEPREPAGRPAPASSLEADLVAGADAGATDNLSVWWNRHDASSIFAANARDTRLAPGSVLSLAVDTLGAGGNRARPDVVTGVRYSSGTNFLVWLAPDGPAVRTPPSNGGSTLGYCTNDLGEVRCVSTLDCAGGPRPDILVGTAGPTAGCGTLEVWKNGEGAASGFSRQEIYPPAGEVPGNRMGEVNAMVLADLDGDGRKDLVVGTRTGTYTGDIMIFQNVGRSNGQRFILRRTLNTPGRCITALAALDVDGDGSFDVVAGTQLGAAVADLQYWHNRTNGLPWNFTLDRTVAAPGLVQSLAAADMGGGPGQDVIVGYRRDSASYAGGVRIFYTDGGTLPLSGTDPSPPSAPLVHMVPALTVNGFGANTRRASPSAPHLTDFAAAVRMDQAAGQLIVFIR